METRITKLTIGRLHNLGNYEHIRYEVTVDIAEGDNPMKVLGSLETILSDLKAKSEYGSYDLGRAKIVLSKPASEISESDVGNLEHYKKVVAADEEAKQKRLTAATKFASLGGGEVYTDAKEKWDDDDYDF